MYCEMSDCSKNNAKEYNLTVKSSGYILRIHIFCIDCMKELLNKGLWNIVPVAPPCDCSLILCKECLKNVKEVIDF